MFVMGSGVTEVRRSYNSGGLPGIRYAEIYT